MTETFEVGDHVRTTKKLDFIPVGATGVITPTQKNPFVRVNIQSHNDEELEHVTTTKGDIVATATKTTREVTETRTITETVKVPTITLELSQEEAQTLADIFYRTEGHTEKSRRRFTDRIANALSSVGVSPARYDRPSDIKQSVWFKYDTEV